MVDFETYIKIDKDKTRIYEEKVKSLPNYLQKYDQTGWMDLDSLFESSLINDIKETAQKINENSDVLLVVGIGGSFLAAKAIIEAINKSEKVIFVGNTLSVKALKEVLNKIQNKRITLNIISKSGSTLETTIYSNLLISFMKNKYSEEEIKERLIITTGDKGPLREIAKDYKNYLIKDNIPGRYSAFTPAGLLALCVAGINIDELNKGAVKATKDLNEAIKYAIYREALYNDGYFIEGYTFYDEDLFYFGEWLKQLFAESLGKEGKGIFPTTFMNTKDLHSMGQFIQEGKKVIFETVFNITNDDLDIDIKKYNKSMNEIKKILSESVSLSHYEAKVPNIVFNIEKINEEELGYLFQFFMLSCMVGGHLANVNAFNQEGVSKYKNIAKDKLENK